MKNPRPIIVIAALAFVVGSLLFPASRAGAAPPCVTLAGQSYCQVWSNKNQFADTYEYLRKGGETVDHWQNMITIVRYNQTDSLDDMLHGYTETLQSNNPKANPQWIVPDNQVHGREAATRVVLSNDKESEYVVNLFFTDPGKRGYAIVFSQHMPLPGGKTPSDKQYAAWLADMQKMQVP